MVAFLSKVQFPLVCGQHFGKVYLPCFSLCLGYYAVETPGHIQFSTDGLRCCRKNVTWSDSFIITFTLFNVPFQLMLPPPCSTVGGVLGVSPNKPRVNFAKFNGEGLPSWTTICLSACKLT